MKKNLLYLAAAALMFASCYKENEVISVGEPLQQGTLTISVSQDGATLTRADAAFGDDYDYEKTMNSLQIFVFESTGKLNAYHSSTNRTDGCSETLNVTLGDKHVWALVNGPDMEDIVNEDMLKQKAVQLGDNGKESGKGFIMVGSKTDVKVTENTTNITVNVSRLVGRVVLRSIKNDLPAAYDDVFVSQIFLSNVVGNQQLSGTATPSTWYNKEGRADESTRNETHIISSTYPASCPALTYVNGPIEIATGGTYSPTGGIPFYGYPNSSTTAPNGFHNPFQPQQTTLVVEANIDMHKYYYPIVLKNGIARNTTYTVYLTIKNLGSTDPNTPVQTDSFSVTIDVDDWITNQSVLSETI